MSKPPQDPRIAPKEMIITRFKSAQQKKKLQEKQQVSNKTEPASKSPETVTKTPQTATKSPTTPMKLQASIKVPQNCIKVPQTLTKVSNTGTKQPQGTIKVQMSKKVPQTATKVSQTVTHSTQTSYKVPQNVKPVLKTYKSSKKKAQKSPNKSKEASPEAKSPIIIEDQEDEYTEYYPDKLKREPGSRKVFLKPKQKSTTIARTNKRKFNTPKRGISPTKSFTIDSEQKCPSPEYSELSMEEVIRMVEENDSLDDEDLMEILTCPSPVWWEEPPDEMYIEEAICTRKPEEKTTGKSPIRERCLNTLRNSMKISDKSKTNDSKTDSTTNNKGIKKAQDKKDDKFIKKSKKLENVLGNIKNKAFTKDVCKANDRADINKEESVSGKESDVNSKENTEEIVSERNIDSKDKNTSTESDKLVEEMKTEDKIEFKRKTLASESTDDSLGDLNCQQELLIDLENIEIPVRDPDLESPDCIIINDENSSKIIDLDDEDNNLDFNVNHDTLNTIIKCESYTTKENTSANIVQDIKSEVANIDKESLVPKNMPPLIKCPKINNTVFLSPNSYKSICDEAESSSISGTDIIDTISDTNIKYIMDDDLDEVSDTDSKNKQCEENDGKELENFGDMSDVAVLTNMNDPKSKETYITVYKIMPNDEQKSKNKFKSIPEYSSYVESLIQHEKQEEDNLDNEIPDNKGQLNSFFKKCKNANRKRKKIETQDKIDDDSICKSPKRSITVAQAENVKYCMKCSSIFDTEDCSYCMKAENVVNKAEKTFTCDKCDFVGETTNVDTHLEEHNLVDDSKT